MWDGFVTVGRGELLLTLVAVALLMFIVGIAAGQIYLMINRPAVVAPPKCLRMHCDDGPQMAEWLKNKDFSLITNEQRSIYEEFVRRARQSAESTGRHAKTDIWPGMAGKISEEPE